MLKTTTLMGALALLASGFTTTAQAASFDCDKAQAADEVAVCKNATLSELDSEMGGLWYAYKQFPMLMGASGARHDRAEAFLKRRAACGSDKTCLRKAYEARNKALKKQIDKRIKFMKQDQFMDDKRMAAMTTLPTPVSEIVSGYGVQCSKLGGTLSDSDAIMVMAADLDGDGKKDYVLNPKKLECSAAATAYCGNGGCQINVALSGEKYKKPVEVMGAQPTLVQKQDGTYLKVWVDRTNCSGLKAGGECWAVYSWPKGKLKKEYDARPKKN